VSSLPSTNWETLPALNGVCQVATGNNKCYALTSDSKLFTYQGGSWSQHPGEATCMAARGDNLFVLGKKSGDLYSWKNNNWVKCDSDVRVHQISVSSSGNLVGVNQDTQKGYIWQHNMWNNVDGVRGNSACINSSNEIFVLTFMGDLYQQNNGLWRRICGDVISIDCSTSSHLLIVDSNKRLLAHGNFGWNEMANNVVQSHIDDNGRVIFLTTGGEIKKEVEQKKYTMI